MRGAIGRLLIRDRITLVSVAVLAVGLAAISIATNLLLSQQLNRDVASILKERTTAQLSTLVREGARLSLRDVDDSSLDRESWAYAAGRAIERPLAAHDVQVAADRLANVARTTELNPNESTRLRATPIYADNGSRIGTVVVAASLAPYEHSERIARIATIALSLTVLLLGALVARSAVRSALRPVGVMAARAANWSGHEPGMRMSLGPARDELSSLAATLDSLLGRIDAALRHEQRFSAEVAHEMRTPLSGLRAEAELALRRPTLDADTRESLESILAAADRMASAIDTLLLTARTSTAQGSTDPTAAISEVTTAYASAARAAGVTIDVGAATAPVRVDADHELVAQALAPLVDNAIGHAESRVLVTSQVQGASVVITVQDDGAGIVSADGEDIFGAGTSSRGGAGLGLPLARRLARACGGDVLVSPSADRGARFELRLPGGALPVR